MRHGKINCAPYLHMSRASSGGVVLITGPLHCRGKDMFVWRWLAFETKPTDLAFPVLVVASGRKREVGWFFGDASRRAYHVGILGWCGLVSQMRFGMRFEERGEKMMVYPTGRP